MGKVLLAFTTSLDGFIAGPDVGIDRPMGRNGERLHEWLFTGAARPGVDRQMARNLSARIGAVILGRRTFDIGFGLWEDTPYPAPSFVLTHQGRADLQMKSANFTFVTDGVESALEKALRAAAGRDVVVMGANAAQQYLNAGLADELVIQVAPVLLGAGTRLFDNIGSKPIDLSATAVVRSPLVTHLGFAVGRPT